MTNARLLPNDRPTTGEMLPVSALFHFALPVILLLLLSATAVKAQCPCTPVFTVGTGTPYPTLSSAISSNSGFSTPGATCIRINGQFHIDAGQTWTLNGTSLVFENATSSIIVEGTSALIAQSATFRPCSSSWLGIFVQTNGSITANQCTFENATNAGISVVGNTFFQITGSSFKDCNKGVKITGQHSPANHLIQQNQFSSCNTGIAMGAARNVGIQHNSYFGNQGTSTGISLESVCENIEVEGGTFSGLYRGISTVKTVNLEIRGSLFQFCQTGVFSVQGSKTLHVIDCSFSRSNRGVHIFYHDTDSVVDGNLHIIGNSFVAHVSHDNIYVDNLGGSGEGVIQDNDIQLPISATSQQYGIEVQTAYAQEGLIIENNSISYLGTTGFTAPGGILVVDSKLYCLIRNNTVVHTGSSSPMPFGIRAYQCDENIEIVGNSVDGGPASSNKGICVEDCQDMILLCCNALTNSDTGLYIKGPLNGSLIYNTTFGAHSFAALFYDQITSTGAPQVNHGNDWSGASGLWDAYFNGGSPGLVNYVVSTANMPSPDVFEPLPGSWFTFNAAIEPSCVNTSVSYCGQTPSRPEGTDTGQGPGSGQRVAPAPLAQNDILAFPNPADQVLYLRWEVETGHLTGLFLLDNLGRVVMQQQVPAGMQTAQLSVGSLPAGLYWLSIRQEGKSMHTEKVVIMHE